MTMIAIACTADRAAFMTDTIAYTRNVGDIAHNTKFMVLPHLDAAILNQGDSAFGHAAKLNLLAATPHFSGLDTLLEVVPEILVDVWAERQTADGPAPIDGLVFLVGYSHQAQRFVAYGFASDHDFTPFELGDMWATPMPLDARPSPLEIERLRREYGGDDAPAAVDELFRSWQEKPPLELLHTPLEWMTLALRIRYLRSCTDFAKVIVGGSAFLTVIGREGTVENLKLLDFEDDDEEEWGDIVAGTDHPAAQITPCDCGSGKRWIDCCALEILDEPCSCGAARTFRDCCMVREPERITRPL